MQSSRFMVVDADDFQAMLTEAALAALGAKVDKFTNARAALKSLSASPREYRGIVACELENMARADFAREAHRCNPALRLVFTGQNPVATATLTVVRKTDLLVDPVRALRALFEPASQLRRAA
jgi:hypothetical protein